MKSFFTLAALASTVAAFPRVAEYVAERQLEKRQGQAGYHEPTPGFDAEAQLVSTTGKYKWVAPTATDARGPCPGLNALANHGYLPHNGIGTNTQFIEATLAGLGMSADLSGFLTVLGSSIDGDGLQWSIGGPNAALPGLPPLLGTPQGISGSHNKYEADVSPGRGDLYKFGNDYELEMSQYQELYNMGIANGDQITLELLETFRASRFQNSVDTNPYFFNGPFTGVLVAPAAFSFIYRFMGNKSAEHPNGYLNTEVMNSFFGVVKQSDGTLMKKPGYERIPDNWYKRAIGDEYSIPLLNMDTVTAATNYPQFLTIGGNTGKDNSLASVDPEDVQSGISGAGGLLKGNNLACFAMSFATNAAPDLIKCSGVIADVEKTAGQLNSAFEKAIVNLGCPQLGKPDTTQFKKFPGYSDLNCQTGMYSQA